MKLKLISLLPLMALAGCAPGAYCEGEFTYQEATSVPAVQPAGDLKLRDSASALKIPPQPANDVPYAEEYVDAEGEEAVRCLDRPPEMPPVALPPQPEPAKPKAEEKKPS